MGMLLLVVAALIVLLRHLGTKRDARELWRSSIATGFFLGTLRAVLACVGWYGLQHTGGPLQIPAYALSMLALPEATVLGSPRGVLPVRHYLLLALLLILTSVVAVGVVGLAVHVARRRRDA